jgi:hypothetical protein
MTSAYCDFTYYQDTYLGDAIAEGVFPKLALRASAAIDRMTFNRAATQTDLDVIDRIKMATCAVAEEIQKIDSDGGVDAIQSENIGGNSVTYAAGAAKLRTNQQRQAEAAGLYLGSTGLLYPGFTTGEYSGGIDED